MNDKQLDLLKGLCFGYADITVLTTKEESKSSSWFKHSQSVVKYAKKRKPKDYKGIAEYQMISKMKELQQLDAEWFEDKYFSSYLCMIKLLSYLIVEWRDIEMRNRFGHFDFKQIEKELEFLEGITEVSEDSNRYIGHVVDNLKGIR